MGIAVPNYILTGAPGSGKTAILRQLELNGHAVVEEAATDVIAVQQACGLPEPWRDHDFIDRILALQMMRQVAADTGKCHNTFFDRSPVCTLALSRYLSRPPSRRLLDEIVRLVDEHFYERTVFFVCNQGFVQPSAARRISFEDSLIFEEIHEQVYRSLGFDLIDIAAARLSTRVDVIQNALQERQRQA